MHICGTCKESFESAFVYDMHLQQNNHVGSEPAAHSESGRKRRRKKQPAGPGALSTTVEEDKMFPQDAEAHLRVTDTQRAVSADEAKMQVEMVAERERAAYGSTESKRARRRARSPTSGTKVPDRATKRLREERAPADMPEDAISRPGNEFVSIGEDTEDADSDDVTTGTEVADRPVERLLEEQAPADMREDTISRAGNEFVPIAEDTEDANGDNVNQLSSDREVQSYGLVVNRRYRLIICAQPGCEYALMPTASAISGHLRSHGRPIREYRAQVWLDRHNIPASPIVPASPCVAVTGIAIKDGFICSVAGCGYACSSDKNLRSRHRLSQHADMDTLPFRFGKVQLVYAVGDYRRYVVALPRVEPGSSDVCNLLAAHDDRIERERRTLNLAGTVKETSQWLVRSGIAAFATPFSQIELLALSELTVLPDVCTGWLGLLSDASGRYFDSCVDLLDAHADDVVLRHIRSRVRDPDHRPMSRIDNTAKYRGIFARLLAFTLRASVTRTVSPFALNAEQTEAADALRELCADGRADGEGLLRGIHRLALALFAHDYDGHKPYSTPLVTFSFLVTLDRFHGYFLPPGLVTPYTAALTYAARCIIYAEIREQASETGETTFRTMPRLLHWIKVGEPNAFDALRQVHDTARNISMHTASPDRVFWASGNRTSFRYLGQAIQVPAIRRMVSAMSARLDELEASLGRHADLASSPLTLPAVLYDDPANLQPGYSFVSEEQNGIDTAEYSRRLLRSGHFCRNVPGTDVMTWIQSSCTTWMEEYVEFSTLIATLMHMCAGQPPRGTEALQTLMVNADRRRSLICTDDAEMLWVLDYNKSSEITGGFDRTIIRGLDQHLGDVVKRNVAFIRKFAQLLAEDVFDCDPASVVRGYKFLNRGIFGRDIGTDDVTTTMKKYSTEHVGVALGVSDWRHIMTSMARHLIRDLDVATTALQEDLDYQEGHSSLTAQLHYGRERNGLTSQLIARFLPLSRCVHKILGRPLSVADERVPADVPTEDYGARSGTALRAEDVAQRVIDGLVQRMDALKVDEAALAANMVTLMDSRLRELAASLVAQTSAGITDRLIHHGYLPLYPCTPARPRVQPASVLDRRGRTVLESLRALLEDADATFKSLAQREAIEAILRDEGHTATFLPTAGGKSMLWNLVCAHFDNPTDVTVVHLPWIVLAESQLRTSLALGIPAGLWTRDNPRFYKLTFVLPESGSTHEFHAGLRTVAASGNLKRFFLDEVHAWVMDSSYRPAMLDAAALSEYGIPIHMLSATVPIDVYYQALRQLGISSIAAPKMFRELSVRCSIRYCVFELRQADFIDHIAAAATRLLTRGEDRAIVFVRRVAEGEDVARRLGCDVFHSGLVPEDRTGVLARWEKGERNIIVATTLLSTGYHVSGVRLVVDYGASWNYITHSQGTGRGGRGDTYCEAHILLDPSKDYGVPNPSDFGHREMMRCFRTAGACLREGMGVYLDGRGERCLAMPTNYVPCARCAPVYRAPESGDNIPPRAVPINKLGVHGGEMSDAGVVGSALLRTNAALILLGKEQRREADEYLRVRLEMLRNICRGCWLRNGTRRDGHATQDCLEDGNLIRTAVETARGCVSYYEAKDRVVVDGRLVCIWCWVPRTSVLHPHTSRQGCDCRYDGIVPQVCFGTWIMHREFIVASQLLPAIGATTDFDAYWDWVCARDSDEEYPNGVHLFLIIVDHVLGSL